MSLLIQNLKTSISSAPALVMFYVKNAVFRVNL